MNKTIELLQSKEFWVGLLGGIIITLMIYIAYLNYSTFTLEETKSMREISYRAGWNMGAIEVGKDIQGWYLGKIEFDKRQMQSDMEYIESVYK